MSNDERTPPRKVRVGGLEEAQLADLAAIDEACAGMYWELGFDGAEVPKRSELELARLPREHDVYVAEADHVAAGLLAWRDEAPGVAYVADLIVSPELHRFGIGSRLVGRLFERARELGLEVCACRSWEKAPWAMKFWQKQGFAPIDDAAPAKIRAWRDARLESGRPLARPGEAVLWAKVPPPPPPPPDESEEASPE